MSLSQHTLPNGLRLIAETLPHMETVALAVTVDVGARWEQESEHGLSHLLEHMAFKGTSRYSAQEIAELFDGIGGQFNAFTSHEHTVYYVRVLKEHWQLAIDLLCDILQDSLFDETELSREKQVILQELAMHQDTPDDVVFDLFQAASFGETAPLGRSILGTASHINQHSREDLLHFVQHHYHPGRICISAAGALDAAALFAHIEARLSLSAQKTRQSPPKASFKGEENIVHKPLEQLQLMFGLPGVSVRDPDYYPLQLLSNLLGGGMSSRLFQEVREKRGLVYTIQSFTASYADCGAFGIYAATGAEQVSALIDVVCEELHRLPATLSEAELERTKQQYIAHLRMSREHTSHLAEWMGRHLLHYGEYRDAAQLELRIQAITRTQLQQLAENLLQHIPQVSFAALGPIPDALSRAGLQKKLAA